MTPAQLAALKADIQARPEFWANDTQLIGDDEIAAFYNLPSDPAVLIWKRDVTINELNSVIAWPDLVALPVEKQLAFQSMIWANTIDMGDPQVRQGIDAIFGNPSTSRSGIINVGRRTATNLEALFSTGSGVRITSMYNRRLMPQEVSAAIKS